MSEKLSDFFTIIIVVSMVIWGGSWVSAKAIAGSYDPFILTFLRFFVSAVSFIPLIIYMKLNLFLNRETIKYVALGAVSMGLYFYLFFKGLETGLAGVAGVFVTSLIPIFTLLLSKILFKKSFRKVDYIGIFLGFIGGAIIIKFWQITPDNIIKSGNIYFLFCPLLWAIVTISSEKSVAKISPLIFSFYCYLFCSVLFFMLSLNKEIGSVLTGGLKLWGNIVYLAIISSTIATTAYFYATKKISSYRASSFAFIVPASSLILSVIFLGEKPDVATLSGGLISVFATYLINTK